MDYLNVLECVARVRKQWCASKIEKRKKSETTDMTTQINNIITDKIEMLLQNCIIQHIKLTSDCKYLA